MNIIVFQEHGSGEHKIEGVLNYGSGLTVSKVISIDCALPDFIEDPEDIIEDDFTADLVLNFLKHPDLIHYLISLCEEKNIPVVSAGKKGAGFTPFTCCGLGRNKKLGKYGDSFGLPEYKVALDGDVIKEIEVIRGAPCGATWDALQEYIGCRVEDVLTRLPRQVQYFCSADPSGFDPVSGKSPVHYAGYVHIAALQKAIAEAG
ncbi:MAG: hypothetical protein KAR01_04545 [Desulfocapsa sp.]|nr:hypothetical protein [Desulfocapsa sp.]